MFGMAGMWDDNIMCSNSLGIPAMDETIRWSVTVSREGERGVRSLISGRGARADSISRFVERAVRKELFGRTLEAVRARNAATAPAAIEADIAAAISHVRAAKTRRTRR